MRIAIAGSSGMIGSALRTRLVSSGHEVVPMVRATSDAASDAHDERIGWDPVAGVLHPEDLIGCDAVVNLAGPGIADRRWSNEYRRLLRDARVDSTRLISGALASLARDHVHGRPEVLVNGSAIGYYGDRGDEELTEDSAPGTGFLPSLCVDWEAATTPAREAGVTVSILRTGIVLDPDDGALSKMLPLFRRFVGGRFGTGRQWMSWISLRDEVRAIEFLLEQPRDGAFNATAPHPVRNREFVEALGGALGRPAAVPVPAFGPRLILGRDLANALLFDSARVLPDALGKAGFEFDDAFVGDALSAMLNA